MTKANPLECNRCGQIKTVKDFCRANTRASGLQAVCRKCAAEQKAEWRAKPGNREEKARRHIQRTYGITPTQFDAMVISQSGRCAICSLPLRKLQVDHCHVSGKVRGLLCNFCNPAIGLLLDDLDIIKAAYWYVKKHRP